MFLLFSFPQFEFRVAPPMHPVSGDKGAHRDAAGRRGHHVQWAAPAAAEPQGEDPAVAGLLPTGQRVQRAERVAARHAGQSDQWRTQQRRCQPDWRGRRRGWQCRAAHQEAPRAQGRDRLAAAEDPQVHSQVVKSSFFLHFPKPKIWDFTRVRFLMENFMRFPRKNLNEIMLRFSREYFNESVPRFSGITDFYQDYSDFGLIYTIGTILTIRIFRTFCAFRALRIFSLWELAEISMRFSWDSLEILLRSHNNLMRFL